MKLNECEKGDTCHVQSILVAEAIGRRLEALGVNERTPVTILNKKKSGSVIIKVRGTRLALGRRIAEGIEVEETRRAEDIEVENARRAEGIEVENARRADAIGPSRQGTGRQGGTIG